MDSFFPEVFGFALDGLVIFSGIGLFQFYFNKKSQQRIIDYEEDERKRKTALLVHSMKRISAGYVTCCYMIAVEHGADLGYEDMFEISHDHVNSIFDALSGKKIDDESAGVIELVEYVKENKSILEAALPIAANIDDISVHSWVAFLGQVNMINNSNENYGPHIMNSLSFLNWIDREEDKRIV